MIELCSSIAHIINFSTSIEHQKDAAHLPSTSLFVHQLRTDFQISEKQWSPKLKTNLYEKLERMVSLLLGNLSITVHVSIRIFYHIHQ